MKLYFLSILLSLALLFTAARPGNSALSDAKAVIRDTVVIAGKVWMRHNLSVPAPNSFWYENDSASNSENGRLYFFSSAQLFCPKGWHLPMESEWQEMLRALGADSLNALPELIKGGSSGLHLTTAGYRSANSKDDLFGYKGKWGFYWTSTVRAEQTAWAVWLNAETGKVTTNYYRRANAFSVRYVRD